MIDLTPIINAVILLIAAVIGVFLVPLIKQKFETDKLNQIYGWVTIAVEAAEQIYRESGMGEKKKAYVLDFLTKKGYTVDLDSIDAMIESAVLSLKQ